MRNEYSIECEICKTYNISPVKCEKCWRKSLIELELKWLLKNRHIINGIDVLEVDKRIKRIRKELK